MTSSALFARWQMRALTIGAIATIVSIIGVFTNHAQFFHSYLFAWLFWVGISLGALVVVMMQALTAGLWGLTIRNLCYAAFMTLPLMALLFVPILIGLHDVYRWSNGILDAVPGFHHKQRYLNVPFFIGRSIFYFIVLLAFAWLIAARLRREPSRSPAALGATGLISYVLCMNFASTDWVMSLDPQWYSTVFVIVFAAGQFLAALALMTALLCIFTTHNMVPTKAFHDLGNMLLTFVIFWIYVSFSQLLITWSGNLPKEISWYLARSTGGWQWLALVLMLGEFLLPFALLLSREAKRKPQRLIVVCLCIVAANVLNNFWLVAPMFHPHGLYVHWLDVTEFVAIGGLWFACFFYLLKQRSLLPAQLPEVTPDG